MPAFFRGCTSETSAKKTQKTDRTKPISDDVVREEDISQMTDTSAWHTSISPFSVPKSQGFKKFLETRIDELTSPTHEDSPSLVSISSSISSEQEDEVKTRYDEQAHGIFSLANNRLHHQRLQSRVTLLTNRVSTLEYEAKRAIRLLKHTEEKNQDLVQRCEELENEVRDCRRDKTTIEKLRTRIENLMETHNDLEQKFLDELRKHKKLELQYKEEIIDREETISNLMEQFRKYREANGEGVELVIRQNSHEDDVKFSDQFHVPSVTSKRLLELQVLAERVPLLEEQIRQSQEATDNSTITTDSIAYHRWQNDEYETNGTNEEYDDISSELDSIDISMILGF